MRILVSTSFEGDAWSPGIDARGSRPSLAPIAGPPQAGAAAGRGRLAFARVDGATSLVRAEACSPLQIVAPRRRGPSAWAFLLSHGGGLVAGDRITLDVEVGPGAAALLATQAETKVYHAHEGQGAAQHLAARVAEGATLALLPEPVSPFAAARYDQRQSFHLAEGASLLVLDAVVAGRSARDERWSFDRHHSVNEVWVAGRRVFGDALLLEPRVSVHPERRPVHPERRSVHPERRSVHPERSAAESKEAESKEAESKGDLPHPARQSELSSRLGRFEAFATAFALGPSFAAGAAQLLAELAERPVEPGADLLAAASPLGDGLFLRCAATSAEGLTRFLHRSLAFAAGPLGANPFAHHW
jgi:urease accessory protein